MNNSNKQPVQGRYIQNALQSCMHLLSSATHRTFKLVAVLHSTPSSSNVTAGGSQYVICAKYEIHKKFNQQLQPSMFSRGYSCGTTRVVTCRLIIISCLVPPCLEHGMLQYWPDLWREWLCIRYFYIRISNCLWCVWPVFGQSVGSPCSNYSDTTLRCETSPSLPPTTLTN